MLFDVDCRKAAAFLGSLIDKSSGGAPIRAQLENFAAASGLQV
jgi:hypothetical protein